MALSGLVAGGVQSALDDVLERRMREQMRQQQEQQQAAQLAMQQQAQQAQQENQRRTIDLADLRRRDDNNRQGLELMQQDKTQMDDAAFMGALPEPVRKMVELRKRGVTPEMLQTPEDRAAEATAAEQADLNKYRQRKTIDREFERPQAQSRERDPIADYEAKLKLDAQYKKPESGPSPYSAERAARTVSAIDGLMGQIGGLTAGLGSMTAMIPGTPARDFSSKLDTVKANIAFNELAAMREASKTGGALGAVSDREMQLLQSVLGGLDAGQSPSALRQQLQQAKESIQRWQAAGGQPNEPMRPVTSRPGGDAAAAAQALIDKARAARGGGM